MARISGVAIKHQPEHHMLTIRKTIDFMKEYSNFMDQTLEAITRYMDTVGIVPSGGPIVCFHNMDLEYLDVEAGWAVATAVAGNDEITANTVCAQKVATAIDQGPYEEQDSTLMDIFAWIEENGYEPQGPIYYHYLNDTDRSPEKFLTQMVLPVK